VATTLEKITKRIGELTAAFEGFIRQGMVDANEDGTVTLAEDEVWRYLISGLQTISIVCSDSSPHYNAFKMLADAHIRGEPLRLRRCLGVLYAVADDLKLGLLGDIGGLVAAEVFRDLLDMSGYLLEQGYHLPSAAIAGAVLEDALRQLCRKHSLTWTGDSSISKLNAELYRSQIFDRVQFGNVEAWGKLRNKVDHGDFTNPAEINRNDVDRMVGGVRDLIAASGLGAGS
jgi:hypothetical protein